MADSLRIAIALPGLHRVTRGAETAFEQISLELGRMGHRVTVFGSGEAIAGRPYQYQRIHCVAREHFEKFPKLPCLRSHYAWEELTFSPGLLRRYCPEDFDISLACSYPYMNWILRRGGPAHVFVTQNGDWMAQAKSAEYRFFNCDGLVCTNAQYFERQRNRFPSALIPNGVDPAIFCPGEGNRAEYGLPEGVKIALMVSALIPSKRVIEGVRAAAKVPGLFLVVAGDGECRGEIQQAVDELLPGRFLRVTLPREKMPGLYRCADLFLHLSRDEPSANAYMEALASGLPIVTHDWDVTRWTLEDCAVFVNGADESAVVAGLHKSLDAKSSAQIAARRELVERRFAWSSIARDYTRFFQQLLEGATAAPTGEVEKTLPDVGLVAVGRNEGDRLKRCLASVVGKVAAIVYVDSGSSDGSAEFARRSGVEVVSLDMSKPFNAARARNTGLQRLLEISPNLSFVQFVDGDCQVQPGWLARARQELVGNADVAVVCGRRRERFPRQSIYNQLIDWEWNTPIGNAKSCGGDSMMKISPLLAVGSFNPSVMAGEEPELCLRLRSAGQRIVRIDAEMTLHDVAMTRYSQWWRRHVRAGYAAIDVWTRFGRADGLNVSQVRSARVWGLAWPAMVILAGIAAAICKFQGKNVDVTFFVWFALIVFLFWPGQVLRLALKSMRRGRSPRASFAWAWLIMTAKFAGIVGQWRWMKDRRAGRIAKLIEYK